MSHAAALGSGRARGQGGRRRHSTHRRVRPRPRFLKWGLALAALALVAVIFGLVRFAADAPARAVSNVLDAELARAGAPSEVVEFYQDHRPFWLARTAIWTRPELRPEAKQMAGIAARALPAELPAATKRRVAEAVAAAADGSPEALARAEVALSLALVQAVDSLKPGASGAALAFVDPDLPARPGAAETLEQASTVGELDRYLANVATPNPIYAQLRRQYDAGRWTPEQAQLIQANLQRLRVLPPATARRFILVNPAAGELALYEDGVAKDSMKVVVGTRQDPTPMMAGLMRHLVLNPYWEVPMDMVREAIAPRVLRAGPAAFQAEHLQVLSDWGDDAVPVDPAVVDWGAVQAGALELPVRQQPGGDNMMGQVKFMLPNELGIYLHDTPAKWAFDQPTRLISAGCVRLERAQDLVRWLLGKPPAATGPNQKVELAQAVPVYITYLTAAPGKAGVAFHPDVYGRDPAALTAIAHARR